MVGPVRAFMAAATLAWLGLAVAPAPAIAIPAATGAFDNLVDQARDTVVADPAKGIAAAKQLERTADRLDGASRMAGVATAKWLQAEAYLRLDDTGHAAPLIDQALAIVSHNRTPTKLNGDLLVSRASLDVAQTRVAAALADYQQAYDIFRNVGETRSQAITLIDIAVLYQEAKDQPNALKYFSQAIDVYHDDPSLLLSLYNNRGDALKEMGRYDEAEAQFRAALTLAREQNSPSLEAAILRNIARGQLLAGKLDAADRTIAEGLRLARSKGVEETGAMFWSVAAQAALQRGRLPEAKALILHSFAGTAADKTTLPYREAHETAFKIFQKLGDDRQALIHLEALKQLDDQTTQLATSTNTALAGARFDFANQELRIAKLKADELQRSVAYERANARTQRFVFVGAAGVTVVIVAMLAFGLVTIRRSRNEVRAANVDLAASNMALGKALAAKTEFLATTSHEIRTPLNGILGMTQVMLADPMLSETLRDRVGVVHGAGVTMRALVDDILDVAKMETGNMTIEHVPFDPKATLLDAARIWQEQAGARGIAFTLELDDCPARMDGDPARLRQIAFNLLSNAIKFTEHGAVAMRAGMIEEAGLPRLRIAVSDTGIGIAADKIGLIFESFRQADAGTTRKFGGTGLGLAICRNLARAMGGDVSVASVVGAGSTFTIDLPCTACEASGEDEAATPAPHVLLVLERNPITRGLLRAVLEPRAGEVVFANTAADALARIAAGNVEALLIDQATLDAGEDADDALRRLARAAGEAGARSFALWPAPDDSRRAALLATGVDAVIAKPIAGAALAAAIYPHPAENVSLPRHLATRAA